MDTLLPVLKTTLPAAQWTVRDLEQPVPCLASWEEESREWSLELRLLIWDILITKPEAVLRTESPWD